MESLSKAGAVAITDDGRLVMNPWLIYEAFQRPARLGIPNTLFGGMRLTGNAVMTMVRGKVV
ncbi:hypothetical protein [Paenibacillus fonticola]|uniref:hypothetical protein n=1 Tax=Paenibacillus fonticola TaxID=379896 RepID=UPI00038135DF|nr:hypothetical protein [Paenibacillus fonticola]